MIATRNEGNERYKETTNSDNNYDMTKTAEQIKGENEGAMTSDGFPNEESKKKVKESERSTISGNSTNKSERNTSGGIPKGKDVDSNENSRRIKESSDRCKKGRNRRRRRGPRRSKTCNTFKGSGRGRKGNNNMKYMEVGGYRKTRGKSSTKKLETEPETSRDKINGNRM